MIIAVTFSPFNNMYHYIAVTSVKSVTCDSRLFITRSYCLAKRIIKLNC